MLSDKSGIWYSRLDYVRRIRIRGKHLLSVMAGIVKVLENRVMGYLVHYISVSLWFSVSHPSAILVHLAKTLS